MKHAILPNAFGEASVVSLRHRYVLVVNSKTAGTTLKTAAAVLEGERLATVRMEAGADDRAQRVENWLRTPTLDDLGPDLMRRVLLSDDFFRFTTVRDPAERCWSAWIDKVIGNHPEFLANYQSVLLFNRPETSEDLVGRFEHFVNQLVHSSGLLGSDRHWAPQVRVLQHGLFPYDAIGHTERMDEILRLWQARTGLPVIDVVSRVGRRNARSVPFPRALLSEACRADLENLYREDYLAFDYDPNAPQRGFERVHWEQRANDFLAELRGTAAESRVLAPRRTVKERIRKSVARQCRRASARYFMKQSDPLTCAPGSNRVISYRGESS